MRTHLKQYPLNLIDDIFGVDDKNIKIAENEDCVKGLEYAITFLNDTEKEIVYEYYREGMSGVAIGKKRHISSSRVYERKLTSLRKLLKYRAFITNGYEGEFNNIRRREEEERKLAEKKKTDFPDVSFMEMSEFLTVRTRNALMWHSYRYKQGNEITIAELDEMSDKDMIKEFRNIGNRGVEDIRQAIIKAKKKHHMLESSLEECKQQMCTVDDIARLCIEKMKQSKDRDECFLEAAEKRYIELTERE